jgi:hypothetical protein
MGLLDINWIVRKKGARVLSNRQQSPGFVVQTVRVARPFPVNYFTMCLHFKSQYELTDLLREVSSCKLK